MKNIATIEVFALGMIGVVAMTPFIPELIKRVSPAGKSLRVPMRILVALALLQTSVLVLLSAWIGARVGTPLGMRVRPTDLLDPIPVAAGLLIGALGGLAAFWISKPFVGYVRSTPIAVRLLYGGLTEEVLVRWGLLSLAGWVAARELLGNTGRATAMVVYTSVLVTNIVFAAAHLPVLRKARVSAPVRVASVIFLVSLPWGWLCWSYGLESAMIAHLAFHASVEALARFADSRI